MNDLEIGQTRMIWPDCPGSVNAGASRRGRHWTVQREQKKQWEGIFFIMFLQARLPKGLVWCRADVELQFTTPGTKRDPENFRSPVSKPLADALVKAGYIPDDSPEFFEMGSLVVSREKLIVLKPSIVKSQMTVMLTWHRPGAANHGTMGSRASGGTSPMERGGGWDREAAVERGDDTPDDERSPRRLAQEGD